MELELDIKYSESQLESIRDQGFMYMCACPSQVSQQISQLRQLFLYQKNCMEGDNTALDNKTHEIIAKAAFQAHEILQQCLDDILHHEGWDLETLEMPANLRKLMEQN